MTNSFTARVPALSIFPVEIWEHIVDQFEIAPGFLPTRNEVNTLRKLSLAVGLSSSVLMEKLKRLLFSTVDIRKPQHADRLLKKLSTHKDLIPYVKVLMIAPESSWGNDWELMDEDELLEFEEEDEDEWDSDEHPLDNDSICGLISQLSHVETVMIVGEDMPMRYRTIQNIDTWTTFLRFPTIKRLYLSNVEWPIDLIGRSPNLEEMSLLTVTVDREECDWDYGGRWRDHAPGAFPKLRFLDIEQDDEMGVALNDFLKVGYIYEDAKSTTFETLRLKTNGKHEDRWAWFQTLDRFTTFGSDTLTTLDISFPFGYFPNNSFPKHWQDEPHKFKGYVSQLRSLETLRCRFLVYRELAMSEVETARMPEHCRHATEPYLPILMEGLTEGLNNKLTPLELVHVEFGYSTSRTLSYTLQKPRFHGMKLKSNKEPRQFHLDYFKALSSSPIWARLESWLVHDFCAAKLQVAYGTQTGWAYDYETLLEKPLRAQMSMLGERLEVDVFIQTQ